MWTLSSSREKRQAISGGHHSQLWDVKNRQRYYHRRENTDLLLLVNPDWVLISAFFFLWYDSCAKSQFRCFKTWLPSRSVVSDSVVPQAVALQASLFMGIVQVRILEWVAMPFSKGSSQTISNPGFSHCRWILYQLRHQGSPKIWLG